MRGEPEVMPALPGAAEHARIMALAQRQAPQVRAINGVRQEVETLRDALTSIRARNRAKLLLRELDKLERELPITETASASVANGRASATAPARRAS